MPARSTPPAPAARSPRCPTWSARSQHRHGDAPRIRRPVHHYGGRQRALRHVESTRDVNLLAWTDVRLPLTPDDAHGVVVGPAGLVSEPLVLAVDRAWRIGDVADHDLKDDEDALRAAMSRLRDSDVDRRHGEGEAAVAHLVVQRRRRAVP